MRRVSKMGGFLKFEKMITPIFIEVVFWLGFIGSIIFGLFMIGYGIISDSAGKIEIFSGLLSLLLGPIILRIYCEMLIVVFKMQGALLSIRDSLKDQQMNKTTFESLPERDEVIYENKAHKGMAERECNII